MPALPQGLDRDPRQVARIAGEQFPTRYRRRLERFRYGPAAFKVDYGPDGPIPWKAQECLQAGTVHVGGTLEEIAASEAGGAGASTPRSPSSWWPSSRSSTPAVLRGKHTAWAYCHVPHGSTVDMTERMEAQIERFAPDFRQRVLARRVFTSEARNPNCVGGDIAGGANDILQLVGDHR